ncbi:hypothetical protein HU727_002255 [Pseudomonas sp. SWRI153]|uniref:Uncharacterized protein n=1 Tax=Pseudomonas khorasanensis TaxID=2745508 RepID=A0A923JDD6_9PSED|nr:hypothetical protein [Pseudomonas khorasanensis]MBV4484407.1 hypothetical protein [Pseudomonas khorasanensis]
MARIQPFTHETLSTLLALSDRLNLSLYMPAHRTFPERSQDPIRFKNLVRQLEGLLEQHAPEAPRETVLAPFHELLDDQSFWNICPESIAVFAGAEHFIVLGLHQPVRELVFVNSHPYLKPLLRLAPVADRCQVLCLSRDSVRMYEGTAQQMQEVELPAAVPTRLTDALGEELTPRNQQGHPDGFSGGGERGDPMMHESGGGGKQDEINLDRERFFRAVDKAITEHCSRQSNLPLVLVALAENQAVFRALSHNPFLLPDGIEQDPATLQPAQLGAACASVLRKRHDVALDKAFDRFGVALGQGTVGRQLPEIAEAAAEGRVALLLVEAEREIAGTIASSALSREAEDTGKIHSDDVLDELILAVIRQGGEVVVVPPERSMPTETGAAAVYRY